MQRNKYFLRYWNKTRDFIYRCIRHPSISPSTTTKYWNWRVKIYHSQVISNGTTDRIMDERLEKVISIIQKYDVHSVIEVGCGFGWNLEKIGKQNKNIKLVGIDFSKTQLEKATELYADKCIDFIKASAFDIPFNNSSFDVVFTHGVMEFIHPDLLESTIKEMVRISNKYILHIDRHYLDAEMGELALINSKRSQHFCHDIVGEYKKICNPVILCKVDVSEPVNNEVIRLIFMAVNGES